MEPNQDKEKQDVLGNDPFADIEDLIWDDKPEEEADPLDFLESALAEESEAETAVPDPIPLPHLETEAETEAEIPGDDPFAFLDAEESEAETAVPDPIPLPHLELEAEAETEMPVDDPFAFLDAEDELQTAVPDPIPLPHLETEAEAEAEAEMPVDDPFAFLDAEEVDLETAFEAETPSMTALLNDDDLLDTNDPPPLIAAEEIESDPIDEQPEASADNHFLDNLIASIDGEIDALYGAGPMVNLADDAENAAGIDEEQHIIFELAGVEYTVPINNMTEIGRPLDITPVPNVPGWVLGVANLRGDIISMVNLRTFLGLPREEYGGNGRLLVAQSHTEDITVGLLVDRVSGIGNLTTRKIGAPTAPIEDQVAPYLRGVYEYEGRLLVVLNLDKLLRSTEMQQFEIMN